MISKSSVLAIIGKNIFLHFFVYKFNKSLYNLLIIFILEVYFMTKARTSSQIRKDFQILFRGQR